MKGKLFVIFVLSLLLAGPVTPAHSVDQEKLDKAVAESVEKSLRKLGVVDQDAPPTILEHLQYTVTDMPPVKESPVLWQTKMKDYPIQDMRFIAPNRLLVNQTYSLPFLVDTKTGTVLWDYLPMGWTISYCDLVAAFSDLLLIRSDHQRDALTTLAAIDAGTGKQRWYVQYKNKKRTFKFLPVPAAGVVLTLEIEKKKVTMTALTLLGGEERWKQTFKVQKGGHPTPPLVTPGSVWSFYGHTRAIDPATGKILWEREDVVPDNESPPAVLADGRLYIIDGRRTIHALDPGTGKTVLSAPLDDKVRYTNIHSVDDGFYLRGQDAHEAWYLARHDGRTGKAAWVYRSTQPTVSNVIEAGDRLYVATPPKVLCLDAGTGKEIFAANATLTGQSFPIRLRKYGNTIVYIGELVIAGYDAATGKQVYKVGLTPVSQETHLDALDNWMSVLQKRIGKLSKAIWFGGAGGAGDAFTNMAANSQNLSNSYSYQARNYRLQAGTPYNMSASSDSWKAQTSQLQSQMNSSFAGVEAQMGFFFAMEGLKNAMLSKAVASDREEVNRLDLIRQKILGAYSASESGDYVWRAHVEGDWIGLSLIHLPTGRVTFNPFSPLIKNRDNARFNERALWNLVDVETGIVYHPALRSVEKKYQQTTTEGVITYGIRLVAENVKIK